MDVNASIVDQQITGLLEKHPDWFTSSKDENQKRATAFILLCMKNCLDIPIEETLELLTDGGNDAGVDGLHMSDVDDGEFLVTLFQGKYKIKDLEGTFNFPENGVQKAVNTVQTLFDPGKAIAMNPKLKPKVEEIRSLVMEGYIPDVRVVLCNNGARWNEQAQRWIDQSQLPKRQTQWIHFNHDSIVDILRKTKSVDDRLLFIGKVIVEDFNYRRVLVGKVPVSEIAELFNRHNDLLLQRNIRRYLGLHVNRVNTAIYQTLKDPENRSNFYFFNNGITIICQKFRHNALQGENYPVKLENMQIINGGQTCKTIQQTLNEPYLFADYENTFVMVRVYELANDDQDFVTDITYATNSQNPVDLQDLRSNDPLQKQLEISLQTFGYTYKRQREDRLSGPNAIPSSILAEAVLAIWREKPHQAKFRRKDHFGKLYEEIFQDLNGAQALLATLILRHVENARKQSNPDNASDFLPYASHYLAMLVGRHLLRHHHLSLNQVSHLNFANLKQALESNQDHWRQTAIQEIRQALKACYGNRPISLQQLAATFRRGDLLEMLQGVAV